MTRILSGLLNLIKLLALLATLAVAFPIVWVLSIIGTQVSRTRRGVLQVPTRYYRHPETGRQVIMVGVIHIGKEAFYQQIQKLINQATTEKFKILFEGVGKIDKKDAEKLPPAQRFVVKQMHDIWQFMEFLLPWLTADDVIHQKKGLEYPDTWVRTDLNIKEVSALFADAGIDFMPKSESDNKITKKDLSEMPLEVKGFLSWFIATLIKLLPGLDMTKPLRRLMKPESRIRDFIILDMRNEVAAKAILEHAKTDDVLSIWGAAHLPGIHEYLVSDGYVHQSTKWHDAFWA